jgi:hypothetical protein
VKSQSRHNRSPAFPIVFAIATDPASALILMKLVAISAMALDAPEPIDSQFVHPFVIWTLVVGLVLLLQRRSGSFSGTTMRGQRSNEPTSRDRLTDSFQLCES